MNGEEIRICRKLEEIVGILNETYTRALRSFSDTLLELAIKMLNHEGNQRIEVLHDIESLLRTISSTLQSQPFCCEYVKKLLLLTRIDEALHMISEAVNTTLTAVGTYGYTPMACVICQTYPTRSVWKCSMCECNGEYCPVCTEDYFETEEVRKPFQCNHPICIECDRRLSSSGSPYRCPLCRANPRPAPRNWLCGFIHTNEGKEKLRELLEFLYRLRLEDNVEWIIFPRANFSVTSLCRHIDYYLDNCVLSIPPHDGLINILISLHMEVEKNMYIDEMRFATPNFLPTDFEESADLSRQKRRLKSLVKDLFRSSLIAAAGDWETPMDLYISALDDLYFIIDEALEAFQEGGIVFGGIFHDSNTDEFEWRWIIPTDESLPGVLRLFQDGEFQTSTRVFPVLDRVRDEGTANMPNLFEAEKLLIVLYRCFSENPKMIFGRDIQVEIPLSESDRITQSVWKMLTAFSVMDTYIPGFPDNLRVWLLSERGTEASGFQEL